MLRLPAALLVALLTLAAPRGGNAAPMYTALSTIRANATLIVIGQISFQGSQLVVDVDKVVRGKAKRGPLAVQSTRDGHVFVKPGKRVLVFIEKGAL